MRRSLNVEDLKKVQLEILIYVKEFCKVNQIKFYLFAGSLLGAARHHGYIPWDDDIDICMKREDYNRFLQCFNIQCDPRFHLIHKDNTGGYYSPSCKVIDTRTVMIENVTFPCPIGVYIDVFPMDYVPLMSNEYNVWFSKLKIVRTLLALKNTSLNKARSPSKNIILFISQLMMFFISKKMLLDTIEKLATRFQDSHNNSFRLGDVSILTYGEKELFSQDDFSDVCMLKFEDQEFPAPLHYENILTSMYGDYMVLPPEENRISHHDYVAYWKE